MRKAGVEAVVEAESLSVVGLVEVISHLPRIHGEFRKILAVARERRPRLAILTDSPDFHLRLAGKLVSLDIPVVYLIAPQVWAWRRRRLRKIRRTLNQLLCIFPFEEGFFRKAGVNATYIGHPLAGRVRPLLSQAAFFEKHGILPGRPIVVVLPGSRVGEVGRHLPVLVAAAELMSRKAGLTFLWAAPAGFFDRTDGARLRKAVADSCIQVVEGETWDAIAHADLALAASGTVTVETALLGTPMVTFYRVTALSWLLGKLLVDVPYYTMVNLIAGRKIVPELMQGEMTSARLAEEALRILGDTELRTTMKNDLGAVANALRSGQDPLLRAAQIIREEFLVKK
jgi:lipid-A-disaccharide synthase